MDDSTISNRRIAPHRGFNNKARVVLIGECDMHLPGHQNCFYSCKKASSDQNLCRRRGSQNNFNGDQSPNSVASNSSIAKEEEAPEFDTIGEAPRVNVLKNQKKQVSKVHKQLGEIGKAMSCVELKNEEKKVVVPHNTYVEANVIKMPSIDAEGDILAAARNGKESGKEKFLASSTRSSRYMVNEEKAPQEENKKIKQKVIDFFKQ